MKANQDVMRDFVNGVESRSRNVYSDGNNLYNYGTLIAEKIGGHKVLFNVTKYSVATSKIQSQLRSILVRGGWEIEEVCNVPLRPWGLTYYRK